MQGSRDGRAPGGARARGLVKMLSARQIESLGTPHFTAAQRVHCCAYRALPMKPVREVDRLHSRVYSGRFSASGNVFVGELVAVVTPIPCQLDGFCV